MPSARYWPAALRGLRVLLTLCGVTIGALQIIGPFGFYVLEGAYFYSILGLFLAVVLISFPSRTKRPRDDGSVPWYDAVLAVPALAICGYSAMNALDITAQGWEFGAPPLETAMAVMLWALVLEGVRRATRGWILFVICALFSVYPVFAHLLPGLLGGHSLDFLATATYHSFSTASVMGLTMHVLAMILVGYLLLGVVLQATGGGEFLLRFATALLGTSPGGPAKVAVVSSGLFGSISGSPTSNVMTTGSITIPNMIKAGYPPRYAAAVESCASTGGTLMPPIMGTAAFLMASFLGIPYRQVAMAAIIPSLVFFGALLAQVDLFARKHHVRALDDTEVPSLWRTLAGGWPFLGSLTMLVYIVFFMRQEAAAPFYTVAFLLVGYMLAKRRLVSRSELRGILDATGRLLGQITAILAAVGLIVGSLSITGLASALAQEMLELAGGNMGLLLVLAAVTSIILGTGMPISACYVFLAVTAAPGLVAVGIPPLAAHLFILYWGMMSFITPPVAMASITAAGIADEPPFATAFQSMRLSAIIFGIPFVFVLDSSMLLLGDPVAIVRVVAVSTIAVVLAATALEGYVPFVGPARTLARLPLGAAALLLLYPSMATDAAGIGCAVAGVLVAVYQRTRAQEVVDLARVP